ncbi:MAG: PEP-CTERM sorting domain-containing protein [Desulfuromonadales bacterium]|nr:MAG: PEP-CTERM sorting domain-containing protein [Desulfuromonadales bacterium]
MKKKMIALLAGALMTVAMAGNALAYFENDHLIRVVYDKTAMKEVATDLGSISTILSTKGVQVLGAGADSYLGGALATSSFSNLNVAYYAVNVANMDLYLSSKADTQSLNGTTGWTAGSSAIANTLSRYAGLGGSTVTLGMGDASSYWAKLDGTGTKVGKFNTFYSAANGEMNLAALATGGEVKQNLFFFDNPKTTVAGVKQNLTIKTLSTGGTEVASNVPVPPALFLMGSGLLGLVGIRRKKQ